VVVSTDTRSPTETEDQIDLPIARREFYSIGEACDITGLKAHVLRYWETQFDVLKPRKNRSGNRVFQARDIEMILLLKRLLYHDKYTIEGARRKLEELQRSVGAGAASADVFQRELLAAIKADLTELLEVLAPPSSGAEG
jgi:DNA-binding transcriptional MerR regulator